MFVTSGVYRLRQRLGINPMVYCLGESEIRLGHAEVAQLKHENCGH
jgi:hypothetical protein